MPGFRIEPDDPDAADVRDLLRQHLALMHASGPPESVFALDTTGLQDPAVSFFSLRGGDGALLAVGALKQLDTGHAELKSMHTAQAARGQGLGRAVLAHLMEVARSRGIRQVSLETGTGPVHAPARALYTSAGFRPCEPFAAYESVPTSTFMTRRIDGAPA
jgi:putative acetyltransferase